MSIDPAPIGKSSDDELVARRATEELVLPLAAEEIVVGRRRVEGRTVRVVTGTREHEHLVEEALTHERVEIEHVAVDRFVDAIPSPRVEGDTTILSVVEEVVVLERRLLLKEEIRIRRVRVTDLHRETVVLREQFADVSVTEPDRHD